MPTSLETCDQGPGKFSPEPKISLSSTEINPRRRLDHTRAYRHRGAFGFLFLIPAALIALFSEPLIREGTWLNVISDGAAWIFFAAGMSLRLWSTLYVGSRKLNTLVDQGPYSICRNPLYVGTFLIGCGAAFFLKSLLVLAAVFLVILLYVRGTVPAEEKALLAKHGEHYNDYLNRVPRFWPNFTVLSTPGTVEVKVNGLRLEAKRLFFYLWLPLLGEFLIHLRTQSWWPHWFRTL